MGIIEQLGTDVLNTSLSEVDDNNKTLYSLYLGSIESTQIMIKELWRKHRTETNRDNDGYLNAVGAYRDIEDKSGEQFNDKTFVNELFSSSEAHVNSIFRHQINTFKINDTKSTKNAKSFYDAFQRARKFVYHTVVQFSKVLIDKSFPATFFHQDVVMMFDVKVGPNKLGMFGEEFARKRVGGTSEIILRTLYGAKGEWSFKPRVLANSLMLAEMHNHTVIGGNTDPFDNKHLYNQSSAAFTLLTFSYFIGLSVSKKFKDKWEGSISETDWYFFWKTLGSTMGIRTELLPDTQVQAQALWEAFLTDKGTKIRAVDKLKLLVDNNAGIRSRELKSLGYTEDEKLFGNTLGEVVRLLQLPHVVNRFDENGVAEFKSLLSHLESDVADPAKNGNRKNATLAMLRLLRHGGKLNKLDLKPIEEIPLKVLNDLRKLTYLVNLIHLLEVYKKARGKVNDSIPEGMQGSLTFQYLWPLQIRK